MSRLCIPETLERCTLRSIKSSYSFEGPWTLDDILNEERSVVHHNGEQNYHGGKESQLNFNEHIKTCLYVRDFSVAGIKLKNKKCAKLA